MDGRAGVISISRSSHTRGLMGVGMVSYDETRNTLKQTAQENLGVKERITSQKTLSSSSLKGTQVRKSEQMSKICVNA